MGLGAREEEEDNWTNGLCVWHQARKRGAKAAAAADATIFEVPPGIRDPGGVPARGQPPEGIKPVC